MTGPLDLSGDNRLPEVLEELGTLRKQRRGIEALIESLEHEVRAKIGFSEVATLPGWRITNKPQQQPARPATEFRVLRITRDNKTAVPDEPF